MTQNNMKLSILAPAKVNLFLDVLSKREDGYHEICSVMQAVSLYDEIFLQIKKSDSFNIILDGSNKQLRWDGSNLVYKACDLFVKEAGLKGYTFEFYVQKNIPVCAGMAGGSTDAAGALLLLNKAFNNLFSVERLCEIGAKLGADVPFCILGGTCLCRGVGEKIISLKSFSNQYMVCAIDDSSVSTPQAYSMLDEKFGTDCGPSADIDDFLANIATSNAKNVCSALFNKFENVIIPKNPRIQHIKDKMLENNALGALMSGSGPSVFAIFASEADQKSALFALQKEEIQAFLCKSL